MGVVGAGWGLVRKKVGERCEEGSEHIRGRGAKVGEVFFD